MRSTAYLSPTDLRDAGRLPAGLCLTHRQRVISLIGIAAGKLIVHVDESEDCGEQKFVFVCEGQSLGKKLHIVMLASSRQPRRRMMPAFSRWYDVSQHNESVTRTELVEIPTKSHEYLTLPAQHGSSRQCIDRYIG